MRGTGFDAWADQHLVGNFIDGNGVPEIRWDSVWVTPQGGLTLEVNLCADPFQNHGALAPGSYTVSVGLGSGQPIAATSIALSPPAPPTDVTADQPARRTAATNHRHHDDHVRGHRDAHTHRRSDRAAADSAEYPGSSRHQRPLPTIGLS